MGEVVKLHCDCGYKTDELYIGCGFNSYDHDLDEMVSCKRLCYCKKCNIITDTETVERNKTKLIELLKSKENRNIKFIFSHILNLIIPDNIPNSCSHCCKKEIELIEGGNELFCPKCKSTDINIDEIGVWD